MENIIGIVEQVLITPPNSNVSISIEQGNFLFEGLQGDRHFGYTMRSNSRQPEYPRGTEIRNRRQITILSKEELAETAIYLEVPEIKASWLAGNLLIAGIPSLTFLPAGSRLFFSSDVVLVTDGENLPCSIPAKTVQAQFPNQDGIASNFVKSAMHRRGLIAWVEKPGIIQPGDTCQIELKLTFNRLLVAQVKNIHPLHQDPFPGFISTGKFIFEPLSPEHVALDYEAVMSSRVFLRKWSQSTWPTDNFTRDENLNDLVRHSQEQANNFAYTYTILNIERNRCLGCIYIKPVESITAYTSEEEIKLRTLTAILSFWVRESLQDNQMEQLIIKFLIKWMKETWQFHDLAFATNDFVPQQISLFQKNGLYLWMKLSHLNRYQTLWKFPS